MKYFGTDGIRGIPPKTLNEDTIICAAKAITQYIYDHAQQRKIMIAKDTRDSSDYIVSLMSSVFLYSGIDVYDLGVAPTATLAYLTRTHCMGVGVMISASHNPVEHNGIKIFDNKGCKFDTLVEQGIDLNVDLMRGVDTHKDVFGRYIISHNYVDNYVSFAKSLIDHHELPCIIDCANGAGCLVAKKVFSECADVTFICADVYGTINAECGCTHMDRIAVMARANNRWGIAFDGDADRVALVTPEGDALTGDHLLYVLAITEKGVDQVVGTQMSNFGLEMALKRKGIRLIREKVGDKYIAEYMRKHNVSLGGEQSGHIIIGQQVTTGDGIITAINMLNILSRHNIKELLIDYKDYPQIIHNIIVTAEQKQIIIQDDGFWKYVNILENELFDEGRILVRPSGTESLIRIMLEGQDAELLSVLLARLLDYIKQNFDI